MNLIIILLITCTTSAFMPTFSVPKYYHHTFKLFEKPTELLINDAIDATRIRLVVPSENGTDSAYGIMTLDEGLKIAKDLNLDLVLINDKGNPPVCKVLDYGKFKYAAIRKKKESNKKQTNHCLKVVKLSCNIDIHDFNVRIRAAQRFLTDGHKVLYVM